MSAKAFSKHSAISHQIGQECHEYGLPFRNLSGEIDILYLWFLVYQNLHIFQREDIQSIRFSRCLLRRSFMYVLSVRNENSIRQVVSLETVAIATGYVMEYPFRRGGI
ncbi:hypothetical protein AVEN_187232-1 [Araneus ventricosus]|uniref:Uncharacterized protein n=1 Tax=Araneus ventricosus TaxID=182803 RepID=A0A4Y2NGN1_ARAVE|nr:hypothetical protein AVEN_187232-1 [Araneus ventricosus]